jgi:WD40 repeat protein
VGNSHNEVRVYDSASGELQGSVALPKGATKRLALSPDGRQIATRVDDDVLLTSVDDVLKTSEDPLSRLPRLTKTHNRLTRLCYSPDGKILATGGSDRLVKFWDTQTGELLATLSGHRGAVNVLCFSPDGHSLLTAGDDHVLKVWNVSCGEELFDLHQKEKIGIREVAISPDGRWLICGSGDSHEVSLFDLGPTP